MYTYFTLAINLHYTRQKKIEHDEVPHAMCKDLHEFTGSTQIELLPSCHDFQTKNILLLRTEQENLFIFLQIITCVAGWLKVQICKVIRFP